MWNAHPEWTWFDQNGERQRFSEKFYVSLNPCLPEVRAHVVEVVRDLAIHYAIDGVHLDYIRFPSDQSPRGSDYPYDARTLGLYRHVTGKRPQDSRSAWIDWRTRQVTQLVREIRQMTRNAHRSVRVTASCGVSFDAWRTQHFQDGPGWLREKLVDLVFVMNYSRDTRTFVRRQQAWHQAAPGAWVAAGIDVTDHPAASVTIEQLRHAAQWGHGFSLFSASALFSDAPGARTRLQAIRPMLLSLQPRPTALAPFEEDVALAMLGH